MELTELMIRATSDVATPPTFLRDVRRGGARRRRNRRGLMAVGTACLVALGALGVQTLAPPHVVDRYAGPLFDGTTHGDLAGDKPYLTSVLRAWNASHASSGNADRGIFDDLRGSAHVVWAGTTPVGDAALVEQDAYLHHHGNIELSHEGIYSLLGFVGVDAAGAPTVVGDAYPDGNGTDAWYVDPDRTVVAVADNGDSYGLSYGWKYGPSGVSRSYTAIPDRDGVGVLSLGSAATGSTLVARQPVQGTADLRSIVNNLPLQTNEQPALPWKQKVILPGGGSAVTSLHGIRSYPVLFQALAAQDLGAAAIAGGPWNVTGRVPDGRTFVVGEMRLDNDAPHLYAVLTRGASHALVQAGTVRSGALPVAVHLPDRQGWVVAAYGSVLQWRTGEGSWHLAGPNAALLPDAATSVRVVRVGRPDAVVPLG